MYALQASQTYGTIASMRIEGRPNSDNDLENEKKDKLKSPRIKLRAKSSSTKHLDFLVL